MATAAEQLEREYWEIVGDPAPDERQRLAALNEQHLIPRLERLLGALARPDIGPVCTGFQVSSYVHAAATPVESGTVILVSDQLFDAALGVCIFMAASAPWTFGSEDAPPDVSEAEADDAIRKIVESAVVRRAAVQIGMHDLAPSRYTGLQMMLGTFLNFVLAHELAHISLGHLRQRASGLPTAIDLSQWQMEFAADQHGFRTMEAASPSVKTEVQYIGPVLLFEIVDLAARVLEQANPEAAADIENYATLLVHPSASARLSSLINGTFGRGPQQVRLVEVDAELGVMAPELPLVDDLVARMRRIRAGTVAQARAEDVERLHRLAAACDRARYHEVFQIGRERDGVAQIDAGAVIDLVEEDHEQAQAWIAFAAYMCLAIGPAMSHAFRSHLGFMNTLYRGRYVEASRERSAEAQRFQQLLKACIPDLTDAEFDAARELHGQRLWSQA